ncbi:MAG: VanZ family protein [Clostridiales bacterium]|nr:VanZ family protein [Clostridiales bacterium]
MKEKHIRIILWSAVLLWMAVIFLFSAKNSAESQSMSDGVLNSLLTKTISGYSEMDSESQSAVIDTYSFAIRKAAHFSEYLLLGILTCLAFGRYSIRKYGKFFSPFFLCVLYAVSDEIHQYFVPGRACRAFDVMIDSTGALFGIAAVFLVTYLINRLAQNRKIK